MSEKEEKSANTAQVEKQERDWIPNLRRDLTPRKVKKAILGSGGNIAEISRRLKCSWHAANYAVGRWPEVEQAYIAEKEAKLDRAEEVIWMAIESGDVESAKWILRRLGRSRGFGDNISIGPTEGVGNPDLGKLTFDQLKQLAGGEDQALLEEGGSDE